MLAWSRSDLCTPSIFFFILMIFMDLCPRYTLYYWKKRREKSIQIDRKVLEREQFLSVTKQSRFFIFVSGLCTCFWWRVVRTVKETKMVLCYLLVVEENRVELLEPCLPDIMFCHCLWVFALLAFKSITITEMLSELFLPYAISVRLLATICAGGVSLVVDNDLRSRRRRWQATCPTSSFVITSQSPSLARTKHSSSSLLVVKLISGTGIIHGRRYLSPETQKANLSS